MSERAETLFRELQSGGAIRGLIGQSEDGEIECKEWHGGERTRGSIAKAVCGLANATGGVIVIGMMATGTGANSPDVIREAKPVSDVDAVKSQILDIIQKSVEPGIEGVRVETVVDQGASKSGFVLIHVPEVDDSPRRSKVDWKFYVRIASGTVPMEYFQIEDRFGRRPHARLKVAIEVSTPRPAALITGLLVRRITLILANEGRGLARFPAVRHKRIDNVRLPGMLDGDVAIWSTSNSDPDWTSIRGGANDVVYPGERLRIVSLVQAGERIDTRRSRLAGFELVTEAICDGMPAHQQSFAVEYAEG